MKLAVVLGLLLFPGCPPGPPPSPTPPPQVGYDCGSQPALRGLVPVANAIAGRYIVVLKQKPPAPLKSLMHAAEFGVQDVRTTGRGYAATIAAQALQRLLADPNVEYVQQEGTKSIREGLSFRPRPQVIAPVLGFDEIRRDRLLPVVPALGSSTSLGAMGFPPTLLPSAIIRSLGRQIERAPKLSSLIVADPTQPSSIAQSDRRKGMTPPAVTHTGSVMSYMGTAIQEFQMGRVDASPISADMMDMALGMQRALEGGVGVSVRRPIPAVYPETPVAFAVGASLPQPAIVGGDGVRQAEVHTLSIPQNLDRVDQRDLPLDGSYAPGADGAGVKVAIVDTGVSFHPDFEARLHSDCFTAHAGGCNDLNGHGTHVSGTIGGKTFGIAKQAQLWISRVLDANGSGSDSDVIRGIEWVVAKKQQLGGDWVINMSLGGSDSPALNRSVCDAIAAGVVVAVAAGNESSDADTSSPARVRQGITVGAEEVFLGTDRQATFSNYGSLLDLYAPGVNILSAKPGGGTDTMSGTSMATPHVAGAVALYLQRHPGSSPLAVADGLVLYSTEGKLTNPGPGSPNRILYVKE